MADEFICDDDQCSPGVCSLTGVVPRWMRPYRCQYLSDGDRRARDIVFAERCPQCGRPPGADGRPCPMCRPTTRPDAGPRSDVRDGHEQEQSSDPAGQRPADQGRQASPQPPHVQGEPPQVARPPSPVAAGSPWPYRPAHLCTDDLPDDDDGPPPWSG